MSKQIKTDVEINYKKRNQATVFWRGILVFPLPFRATLVSPLASSSCQRY